MRISSRFRGILAVGLLLTIVSTATAKYSGGSGTADDPYQIGTAADLIALGEDPNDYDKHFILTADIDLDPNLPGNRVFDRAVIAADANDTESGFQGTSFTGVFDGNGHTISNLTITGGGYLGLFGRTDSTASVSNLGLEAVEVSGTSSAGGLVGCNYGSITTSYSIASVRGGNGVGGLVGCNGPVGYIANCYSIGSVSGEDRVGGLVGSGGRMYVPCRITNSYSNCSVSGNDHVGGLVGWVSEVIITNCYSSGSVNGTGGYVGGLVGYRNPYYPGTISNSFWDIQTSGQVMSAGGTGKTTAEMRTASTFLDAGWDFVDRIENGTHETWQMPEGGGYPVLAIFHGYTMVELQGQGTAEDPYLISNALELGAMLYYNIEAHYRLKLSIDLEGILWHTAVVPRFAGTFDGNGFTISHLTIVGVNPQNDYLGLFGQLKSGAIVKDLGVVDVNITGSADDCVGGLVGYSYAVAVTSCFTTGSVRGQYYVGGLVGYNRGGDIIASHSGSLVSGTSRVGGLLGMNWDGTVTQCYSTGTVIANRSPAFVGGLAAGGLWDNVTACFWDTQTSGQTVSFGGTGKTTAEMQTAATFLEAGWDFVGETKNGTDDIWWILEGQDYPRLWWEATSDDVTDSKE